MTRLPLFFIACSAVFAQDPESQIIHTESRVVLVDSVVTDRKGAYIHDLTQKDFRIWEDNKEQTIASFALQRDDASAPAANPHQLVLFFDRSATQFGDSAYIKKAALQFIDSNAMQGRRIAVMDYYNTLRLLQNFTDDRDRLKQVVGGIGSDVSKFDNSMGIGNPLVEFTVHGILQGIRKAATALANVPGRKTLVFLSAGFPFGPNVQADMTETIGLCNRNNVAIYAIDVRGLVPGRASLVPGGGASLLAMLAMQNAFQIGLASPGGIGSRLPSGRAQSTRQTPMDLPPSLLDGGPDVLYMLASGTGGFVITNTNNLLGGLERVSKDQAEYYVISYAPKGEAKPDACHTLSVKVNRSGANIRSRAGYCESRPLNILSGTATERELEAKLKSGAPPVVPASLQAPFFYTGPDTARVHLVLEIPGDAFTFTKAGNLQHAALNVVGTAAFTSGGVGAKFSDSLKIDLADKRQVEEFGKKLYRYEKQFEIASGTYKLDVAFDTGNQKFGKLSDTLTVDPWQPGTFFISGLALSRVASPAAQTEGSAFLDDQVPLLVNSLRIFPSGGYRFRKTDQCLVYAEIYWPPQTGRPDAPGLSVGLSLRRIGTSEVVKDFGISPVRPQPPGSGAMVPLGLKIPIDQAPPGLYRVAVSAVDSAGRTITRLTPIIIEE